MSNDVDIQKNIDILRAQLGGLQAIGTKAGTDIYKNRSPLDADTHITNIATALATNYGVSDLRDIGVRDAIKPGYASGSDESYTYIPEETVPEYFNKKTDQVIPGYKFASEGRGDGYSEYNLQAIKQTDGSSIVLPIQSYNKSGFGAFQEAIAPIMPILAVALIATGAGAAVGGSMLGAGASAAAAEAVGSAALNLGMQSLAGNINNFSDVLKAVAPSAVTFGISEFADIANSANLAQQDLALQGLGPDVSPFVSKTDAGKLFESITGVSGKVADTLAGSLQGALGAVAGDQDVTLGALGGAFKGYTAKAPIGTGSSGAASIEEANPFKSSFELNPTMLSSAPENTDALSKALGIDFFTSEYQAPTVNTIPYSLEGQTNQEFSTEAFMPGKATTTSTFTPTTQEGMLGDVGSGVSNIKGNTTLGNVTDLGKTNTYGGMLGEIGSGDSNLTNNKLSGDVTTRDTTGVNKGLGGTLGLSNYTGDALYDPKISMQGQGDKVTSGYTGGSDPTKTLTGSDLIKIGTAVIGTAAAGAAVNAVTNTTKLVPTIGKPTYANAPIKGFRMQKVQNAGGLTSFIPFINDKNLLPIPQGYKSI
jgi:hypothetical protein